MAANKGCAWKRHGSFEGLPTHLALGSSSIGLLTCILCNKSENISKPFPDPVSHPTKSTKLKKRMVEFILSVRSTSHNLELTAGT